MDPVLRFENTDGSADDYALDFSAWLAIEPGDTIQGATVTVSPAGMMLIGVPVVFGGQVTQRLSGGVSGVDYSLTFTIATVLGRQAIRLAMLYFGVGGGTDIVTDLAARALRKIGVTMVADASRPGAPAPQTAAQIADDMLRQMGIIVPEALRPGASGTISPGDIAGRALRGVGINPSPGPWPQPGSASLASEVAGIMMVQMGIAVPLAAQPGAGPTVTQADVAAQALEAVGVNPAPPPGLIGTGVTWLTSDIATAALLKLAVIAADETPAIPDQAYALQAANSVHDILVATDFVTWAANLIPNAAFEWYVGMTAVLIAPAFGKPSAPEGFTVSESMIRQLALSGVAGQELAEDKVEIVHEELLALGLVSWPTSTIPASESEHYVRMTAILLAPIYKTLTPEEVTANAQNYLATIAAVRHAGLLRGVEVRAEERVEEVHEQLVALGFVTWNSDAIPASLVDLYAMLASSMMVAEGGKPMELAEYDANIQRIRILVLSGQLGLTLAGQKVSAVHEELNALALVSWSIANIPTAYADWYAELAATKLRPIFKPGAPEDRKADMEADALILGAIKRAGFVVGANARAIVRVGLVHEELNAIGLVSWTSDTIPVSVSDCYMAMASSKMEAEGGAALTDAQYAVQVQRVRMVAMGGPAGQALAEQKVRAVHFSLEARGRVRWTLFDVPDFAEEPYVLKAAVLLGPECGVKVDPTWDIQAERELMRIVSIPTNGDPVRADYF